MTADGNPLLDHCAITVEMELFHVCVVKARAVGKETLADGHHYSTWHYLCIPKGGG